MGAFVFFFFDWITEGPSAKVFWDEGYIISQTWDSKRHPIMGFAKNEGTTLNVLWRSRSAVLEALPATYARGRRGAIIIALGCLPFPDPRGMVLASLGLPRVKHPAVMISSLSDLDHWGSL